MDATVVQMVPGGSIAGMAISLIISVALPIVLLIVWRKKTGASFSSFCIGAGIFILFALILEQIFHSVMLGLTGTVLKDNIWLYALYGGLAAGLFEETGRFTAMKFFMKDPDKKNAIMYGIGHGGIEAILVTGLNMISNLVTSMMINAGSLESILAPLGDERQTLLTQLSALWTEPSWKFYMAGMERVSAVMLHIVLSYLVYMAVKNQKIIWYVLSVLTGRYSSSPESAFARDIRQITEQGVPAMLKAMEDAILSENFWNVAVPQNLTMTSTNNPTYLVYLASQVYFNDISLLSTNITVRELISLGGDVHHVFPKQYLINNHYAKNQYNQDANYAYLDRPVNESIGKKSPKEYFSLALEQCQTKVAVCGSITDEDLLQKNLAMNCIPSDVFKMDQNDYIHFLEVRRLLMANKIRKYYESL